MTGPRFCSGTLSDLGDFYNESTGRGWNHQISFGNEEDGDNGRTFAITKEGDATALPRMNQAISQATMASPTVGQKGR